MKTDEVRLIDANALLDAMPKNDELHSIAVRRAIVDAPTLDVEPVRHGQWVKLKGVMVPENAGRHTCSECGRYALSDRIGREQLSPYCPNCGAKMGGRA